MSNTVVVHKNRTNTLYVDLGIDVAGETLSSEIRSEASADSDLIATWTVGYLTDGTDGRLILTLDNTITAAIDESKGYMDIKRVSAGEPIPVFDRPLEVEFRETVTV